jgi:two-component system cell cycle response regulator
MDSNEASLESLVPLDSERAAHAVEVAPRIWWVGDVLTDDFFQCHAYLVEAGSQSVLIDPGSSLTIEATLRKIQEVISLDDIRWLVVHHADPDIVDSLHVLSDVLVRPDVEVITEWRSALLLKHLAARFPFATIEDLGWSLELGEGRGLDFVLTPYLHFPGAFVSFERSSRSLFSSDLFGGFNRAGRLWAMSADDFEDLRQFHEHYMPSREIVMAGLASITSRLAPIDRVLPQHGYLIPTELVGDMFDQLGNLECGVMLASRSDAHLAQILMVAATIRRIEEILEEAIPLDDILRKVGGELRGLIPLERFWVEVGSAPRIVRFDIEHPDGIEQSEATVGGPHQLVLDLPDDHDDPHLAVVLETTSEPDLTSELMSLVGLVARSVHHVADRALEHREQLKREIELRAETLTDPLTGLLNRRALEDFSVPLTDTAVLMIDIDHFKYVNDDFGHDAGDGVLWSVAGAVKRSLGPGDRAFRYGGEEFVAVMALDPDLPGVEAATSIGERVRRAVESMAPSELGIDRGVTVSVGVDLCVIDVPLLEHVRRADRALYAAKEMGRNRVLLYRG